MAGQPAAGWFTFGTHVDQPIALEFWGEQFDLDTGMPLWERPVPAVAPPTDVTDDSQTLEWGSRDSRGIITGPSSEDTARYCARWDDGTLIARRRAGEWFEVAEQGSAA